MLPEQYKEIIKNIKPKYKEIKEQIAILQEQILILQEELDNCKHTNIVPRAEYNSSDRWFSSSIICTECGEWLHGWYCHTSPTKRCEYAEDDYPQDHCIYCGLPDERK